MGLSRAMLVRKTILKGTGDSQKRFFSIGERFKIKDTDCVVEYVQYDLSGAVSASPGNAGGDVRDSVVGTAAAVAALDMQDVANNKGAVTADHSRSSINVGKGMFLNSLGPATPFGFMLVGGSVEKLNDALGTAIWPTCATSHPAGAILTFTADKTFGSVASGYVGRAGLARVTRPNAGALNRGATFGKEVG